MASMVPSPSIADLSSTPPRPRRHFRRNAALAVIVLLALIWAGYRRLPSSAETGTVFHGATAATSIAAEKPSFRVGTFNIHGGEGRDGRLDLDRTAACLQKLDFVALNEVYGRLHWESAGQAESLGQALQMPWLFAPSEYRWGHDHFGNAVLCSLPVRSWERIPLPRQYGHSCRNFLLAAAEYRGQTLHVVVTHLDRSDDRERHRQFQVVADRFLALAEPAILMGDMNTTADEPVMTQLLATPGVRDPLAEILGDKTPRRIDWLLTRGLDTVDAGLIDNGASDHPCVWAELRLPGDARRLAR